MPLIQSQILKDRYRIVKLLGQGGFGAVYRAWDTTLNVPCAVKESFELSPEGQRQFLREAQILAGLRHANLPRVTDYFALPGQGQYLVMDFVAGDDLEARRAQAGGKLPEAQVLNWIAQVCDALATMHRQADPVIHRDIKPANIKITPPDEDAPLGRAMLVDFGVAKVYDPKSRTTVGARAVTPGYSPHEQYGQTSAATDARTDIYALGATLYSLLTGYEPLESILRVVDDTLVPPRQLEPGISPPVEAIILKAMAVSPKQRYQSAAELKGALNQQLAALGKPAVSTQPPPTAPAAPGPAAAVGADAIRPVTPTPAPATPAPAAPTPTPAGASAFQTPSGTPSAAPASAPAPAAPGAATPSPAAPGAAAPGPAAPGAAAVGADGIRPAPPTGKPTLYVPEEAPVKRSIPASPPVVIPPAPRVRQTPAPARRLGWLWGGLGVGGLLVIALLVVLALRARAEPVSLPAPSGYWVTVLSQGTPITRQAFWYTNDFGDLKTFIEDKLDQAYQITELEYNRGTWTVVMSQGSPITRQAFWYSSEFASISTFIQGKMDEDYQITSLDYSDGLWVVVMSQGTSITRQAYWYSSEFASISTFIQGKMDEDYQITNLEYSNGTWTVVMSQGTEITRQAFWYSSAYPEMEAFIQGKLAEDYLITTLEFSDGLWVTVMSQGTPDAQQAFWFNSDFDPISTFIQEKMGEGYQITSLSR